MSLTIQLPNEVEARLHEWSRIANEPEADVVCRALEAYLAIPPALRDEMEAWQQLGAEAIEKVAPNEHETW